MGVTSPFATGAATATAVASVTLPAEATTAFIAAGAGLAGAFIRARHDRENTADTLRTVLIGSVCAAFTWPIARPAVERYVGAPIDMSPTETVLFGGFCIGFAGGLLLGLALDIIRMRRATIAREADQ